MDTFHHEVALKALESGAFMVNDIYGGSRDARMAQVGAIQCSVCHHVHMQGTPATMQERPTYTNITAEVLGWLEDRMSSLRAQGIQQLAVDVGFGFENRGAQLSAAA